MRKHFYLFFIFISSLSLAQQNDLSKDSLAAGYMLTNEDSPASIKYIERNVQGAFQMDISYLNFDQFSTSIGVYNTDRLNGFLGVFNFDFSRTYNKKAVGFSYGLLFSDFENDSLDIEIIKSQWELHFGYQLVDSKRLRLQPNVGLKWYRYRLLNNHEESNVPLNVYLTERDLDLRFNQAVGFAGLKLAYKVYPKEVKKFRPGAYWTVGVYGNYLFKIKKEPYIYSTRSRLRTDLEIEVPPLNWGIFFSWNFDSSISTQIDEPKKMGKKS